MCIQTAACARFKTPAQLTETFVAVSAIPRGAGATAVVDTLEAIQDIETEILVLLACHSAADEVSGQARWPIG
jgi:hypothetical protein